MTTAANELKSINVPLLTQPLVLISQIQRSGGTLISQLFDGHPEICTHPHELHIGKPYKWDWPNLKLDDVPKAWFAALYEKALEPLIGRGYVKPGSNPHALEDVHPFSFDPLLQQRIFLAIVEQRPPRTQRDILNLYFSSFFAAWSDVSVSGAEKFIAGFCPRVVMIPDSVGRYLSDYPDGHIVSSVRDPRTWYRSSSRHSAQEYPDVKSATEKWCKSTRAILDLKQRHPGSMHVLTYEELVSSTQETMQKLAASLGIAFDPCLLKPTYAGNPILPNSSFARKSYGVNAESATLGDELPSEERAYIERFAMPLYDEAARISGG